MYGNPPGNYQNGPAFAPQPGTQPTPQTYQNGQNWQAPQPGNSNSASPSPGVLPPETGGTNGAGAVPNYLDPNDSNGTSNDSASPNDGDLETPFGFNPSPGVQLEGIQDSVTDANSDLFQPPVPLQPASITKNLPLPTEEQPNSAAQENPYGHDAKQFQWLRGVVDYDPEAKNWNIIFDLTPEATEEYGGSMTLVDDPQLNVLSNDDVVMIEGKVDPDEKDEFGKPKYRITKIDRLVPRK